MQTLPNMPLLSIIIPCYNQGHFLGDALESCNRLGTGNLEVIVVDDGSVDHTAAIASSFPEVHYHYQPNRGLAAARNTGIERATGEYMCFLDADDWFYPHALLHNLNILDQDKNAGLIYGCFNNVNENGVISSHCFSYYEQHYLEMLKINFIGNPSAVIYRREVFDHCRFDNDPALCGCEDYDLYLQVMRNYPVLHNPLVVSGYRRHKANMSNHYTMMLNSALNVLLKHKHALRNQEEKLAWEQGWQNWLKHYGYFPLRNNNSFRPTRFHWDLLRKYRFSLPLILARKFGHSLGI